MATPTLQSNTTGSETIIAGYFHTGEDAHRAINTLLDRGFLAGQIGAAFHTFGSLDAADGADFTAANFTAHDDLNQAGLTEAPGRTFNEAAHDSDTSAGGPSSGTDAVQAAGLAPGSGSIIQGAGSPGPIPGSSLAHTGLPHELKSELAHDSDIETGSTTRYGAATGSSVSRSAQTGGSSWGSKLRHLFQPTHEAHSSAKAENKADQNFGTGEGALHLSSVPYSSTAFAGSVHQAGLPADYSGQLARRLASGGAVVTVCDTGRSIEVENIFEQHNGVVRFETAVFEDGSTLGSEPHIEIFGHLERYYPGR